MECLFRITYEGRIAPDAHPELVRKVVAQRMKLTPPQIERMFCGRKVILRNRLGEAQATEFLERLARIGMLATREAMPDDAPAPAVQAAPEHADTPPAPEASTADSGPATVTEAPPAAAPAAITTTAPAAEVAAEASPPPIERTLPRRPAPRDPQPGFEDSWMTQSSFANLARTHLNLDRAEALLNTGPLSQPPAPPTDSLFSPVTPLFGDGADSSSSAMPARPIALPPTHISTEFNCQHCGTVHRIELQIAAQEPAVIRTRREQVAG